MKADSALATFKAQPVLERLLPFQRDAAEHAYHRLFEAEDSTHRFLVADEVGLGKTLVAKGVIAKAIERLRGHVDRVDIVYVCSNLSIATQNINRLNMFREGHAETVERLTLLPLHLKSLAETDLSLIALTPGTSLDVKSTLGIARERQLIAVLLERAWGLVGTRTMNVMQGDVTARENFRYRTDEVRSGLDEGGKQAEDFVAAYGARLATIPALKDRFLSLCDRIGLKHDHTGLLAADRKERNEVIGELRSALAHCCIGLLEPDLIILDEFQRFKDLLVPAGEEAGEVSEAAELAQQLFNWGRDEHHARLLLLSATPYKPYTLRYEESEDNHYEDFLRTVRFLEGDTRDPSDLKALLRRFREQLLDFGQEHRSGLVETKQAIEALLRKVMSRTERQAVTGITNGMLKSVETRGIPVDELDIRAYLALRGAGDLVEADEPVEYWKAAAYALDFMSGYQLKSDFKDRIAEDPGKVHAASQNKAIRAAAASALPLLAMNTNSKFSPSNPKVRHLIGDLERQGAFDILWVPPSMPSYGMSAPFERARGAGMTKRLVFSSWNVAPRSIAGMVSCEANARHAQQSLDGAPIKEQSALLRLDLDNDRPASMTTLAWMYPSATLSQACDPLEYLRTVGASQATADSVLAWATARCQALLDKLGVVLAAEGQPTEDGWYWAAPLLIDRMESQDLMAAWWAQRDLPSTWSVQDRPDSEGATKDDLVAEESTWLQHFALAAGTKISDWVNRPAPRDLAAVLALFALASPANCALRALGDWMPDERQDLALARLGEAARMGWLFRSLFNRPQAIQLVRAGADDLPYWRQTLSYSVGGDLDAVVREYFHVLRAIAANSAKAPDDQMQDVVDVSADALRVRGAVLRGEQLHVDDQSGAPFWVGFPITTLFGMRYGADSTEDQQQAKRDLAVRSAFNSPFWPFVLASTSVGQEGLDFHWYCHAVVHWNLPPNPVDLEQREGRVHRYKGHAVRKNVAGHWRSANFETAGPDRWEQAFTKAKEAAKPSDKGMIPFWLFPAEDGAWIERHVPLLGLSRDEARYENLKRSLGAYRLVFGQPRQDELLAYLQQRIPEDELRGMIDLLRIDLSPPSFQAATPTS